MESADGLAPKVRTGGLRLEELVMKEIKRRRRQHSREYRRKAVELLLTGKTLAELAADLGIAQSTLISWKEKYLVEMAEEPRDAREISPVVLAQKYEQLLKDHEKLKRQQEILKKALGILSETRLESMP
jgi:transposase-like protein